MVYTVISAFCLRHAKAMKLYWIKPLTSSIPVFLLLLTAACSSAPYRYEPLDRFEVMQRAVAQEQGTFRVRASVPGEKEAEKLFGIPMYDRGIQPVWLEISNDSDQRARLMLSSIDPEYYAPLEVAYMHRKQFSKQGWMDMEEHLYANALPRQIGPQETVSGFVFTHASTGTKAFNVDIFHTGEEREYEQFTFFLEVPGFVPDHSEVNFKSLYAEEEVQQVDNDSLRSLLEQFPCCTSNFDGSALGRPVQVFFVAKARDMLRALLRAGWSETSYGRDKTYLKGADYLFGRPPDVRFRKGRDRTNERMELALWLAPASVDGKLLWAGQVKHAIGRRYAMQELFFGTKLDPDVNDGRNYVIQDLWYAESLQHWAWSETGIRVSQDTPERDTNGLPWFSMEAFRAVIWVSGQPIDLSEATYIDWGAVLKPVGSSP